MIKNTICFSLGLILTLVFLPQNNISAETEGFDYTCAQLIDLRSISQAEVNRLNKIYPVCLSLFSDTPSTCDPYTVMYYFWENLNEVVRTSAKKQKCYSSSGTNIRNPSSRSLSKSLRISSSTSGISSRSGIPNWVQEIQVIP